MIIICKRETKRLVKGLRYEVVSMYNAPSSRSRGSVQVKEFGFYSVNNFTDVDGNPLPKIDIIGPRTNNYTFLKFEDIKEGDILVCNVDRYKALVKGRMYKVEFIKDLTENRKVGHGAYIYTRRVQNIKFEGIPRAFRFNGWSFRKLTTDESREMHLNKVLDEKCEDVMKTSKIRKIDFVPDKNVELVKNLSKSILDPSRHHLTILDWACQKSGSLLGIVPEDYKDLLDLPLKEILTKIDAGK